MKLSFMKTFCDLVETGSFSRAAESNDVSQSAVSQQVARAEKKLSIKLVTRGKDAVSPTDAGKAHYHAFKDILKIYEQLNDKISSGPEC